MKSSILAPILSFAATAAAHGGVLSYDIAGTTYKGFVPYNSPTGQSSIQREWDSYNPIQDPTLATMACNAAGTPGALTATVAAGSTIIAYWNNPWPHSIGPMVVWMANCGGSCLTFEPTGNVWFKINQVGLVSGTLVDGLWGSGEMIAQNSSWTVTIPASLAPGNYLIRHETIAIHTSNAPQWYPECAQLVVTGSGTGVPDASYLAAIPGVYSLSDPEIDINIYSNANQDVTTYTIPGPPVWPSGSGGSPPPPPPPSSSSSSSTAKPTTTSSSTKVSSTITTSSTTLKTSTTSTKSSTTSSKSATSTTSGGISPKYGQCAGIGYTGPTTCAAGSTCTYSSAYYSQCL